MQVRFGGYCCLDALFFRQVVEIILVNKHQSLSQAGFHASWALRPVRAKVAWALRPVRAKVAFDHHWFPAAIYFEIAEALRLDLRFDCDGTEWASKHAVLATDALLLMNPHQVLIGVQATRWTRSDTGSIDAVMTSDRR